MTLMRGCLPSSDVADDMASEDWLVLLGELWSGFDNIGFCSGDLYWGSPREGSGHGFRDPGDEP